MNSVLLFTKILNDILNDMGISGCSEFYTIFMGQRTNDCLQLVLQLQQSNEW